MPVSALKYTSLVEALVETGATPEMILAAVRVMESREVDALEQRRSSDRERQARYRSRNVTSRDVTVSHTPSRSRARVEEKQPTTDKPNSKNSKTKTRAEDLAEFKHELRELDDDRLDAVVKLRRKKDGQLTGYAARLFIRDAGKCGMPLPDFVDLCVSRNWLTAEPGWLENRRKNGHVRDPPTKKKPMSARLSDLADKPISELFDDPSRDP